MTAPKGFPSNQKLNGYPTGSVNNYVTVVPTDPFRHALDTPRFAFRVGSDTVPRTAGVSTGNPASGGPSFIADTSTPAKIGDICRFEDGNAQQIELPIIAVASNGNGFYVNARLLNPPASGDEFFILRSITQRTSSSGAQLVSLTPVTYQPVEMLSFDATSTPITDSAYEEVVASTSAEYAEIEIFNKTGSMLILAVGGSGSEQDVIFIGTDGIHRQSIPIASGSRISLKSVIGNVDAGSIFINAFGP